MCSLAAKWTRLSCQQKGLPKFGGSVGDGGGGRTIVVTATKKKKSPIVSAPQSPKPKSIDKGESSRQDVCSFARGARELGNGGMALEATVFIAGFVTPLLPDGEVVGAGIAGAGGIVWLIGSGSGYLVGCKL